MKNNEKSFTELDIETREDKPTLWVFGCSHSYGFGLKENEKSYGILLSEKLNMPLKLIAKPGSSTNYSLRHLVNANIYENDIVIWQITTSARFSYVKDGKITEIVLPAKLDKTFLNYFTDEQLYFQQLNLLNIGAQYLRAKKVKFLITSLSREVEPIFIEEYRKYPEYCEADTIIDFGYDYRHAGPLTHQMISQTLYNRIQSINE